MTLEVSAEAVRTQREKADFLKYIDSQKRYADFHSNRHTFITNLSLVGVLPTTPRSLPATATSG